MKPTGPAAAAFLSAAIGCFVLGVITALGEASPALKSALNWWSPVGPLSGKTSVAVIVWLLTWLRLHFVWRKRDVSMGIVGTIALLLIVGSFVLLYPPVFDWFGKKA